MVRRFALSPDDPDIEGSMSLRPIRRLPSHAIALVPRTSFKFTQYRSVSDTTCTSSDDENTDGSDIEPELGSGCDEVESLMDVDLSARSSSPGFKGYRENEPGEGLDEGEEIDIALSWKGGSMSPTPSPKFKLEQEAFMGKGKGKEKQAELTVEVVRVVSLKRQRFEVDSQGSDCEADDEAQVVNITRAHKKPRQTLGPTKSIMEITNRVSNLGRVLKPASSEDIDDIMVSSSLPSIPMSPTGPFYSTRSSTSTAHASQGCGGSRQMRRLPSRRQDRRGPLFRRPARSESGSDEEKMITSDVERELERIDNQVQRRRSVRQFPVRLPGQFTSARLIRKSPTSLLPRREKPAHLKVDREGHSRVKVKGMYGYPRVMVGQLLLAATQEGKVLREQRRAAVLVSNKRLDKLYGLNELHSAPNLLPAAPVVKVKIPDLFEDVDIVTNYRTRSQRAKEIWRNRTWRDHRRLKADRCKRHVEPTRLPPPIISPSFRPIMLSPVIQPQSPPIAHLAQVTFAPDLALSRSISPVNSEIMSDTSEISEPPEYEEPPMPVRIPLPPHLRPRPAPRPPSSQVPEYMGLPGSEYSRRSPPPPPPFNAQTDHEVLVAARFLDDDDEEEPIDSPGCFGVDNVRPWAAEQVRDQEQAFERYSRFQPRAPSSSTIVPSAGAQFQARRLASLPTRTPPTVLAPVSTMLIPTETHPSTLVSPVPVRAYGSLPDRSSWEAALDLEEGDEEDDEADMDALLGEAGEAEDASVNEGGAILGTIGRLVRSVWRW